MVPGQMVSATYSARSLIRTNRSGGQANLAEFNLLLNGHQCPIAELEDAEDILINPVLIFSKLAAKTSMNQHAI